LIQPIDGLSDIDNFLKAPPRGAFKKLSGFYISARRCIAIARLLEEMPYTSEF